MSKEVKPMFEVVFINFPSQISCPHWRVSLGILYTSSTYVWPSFSSTLSSGWSPTNLNTLSSTMARQHRKPIFSWVSRALIIHTVYLVDDFCWVILHFKTSNKLVQNLCCRSEWKVFKDAKWCEPDAHHKCFMSQLLMNFLCFSSHIPPK